MLVFDKWKEDHHNDISIKFKPLKGDIAKINLRTKQITIDVAAAHATASRLKINVYLFAYYTLSHEEGHLLYQGTDKSLEEEYFAHDYAIQDCKEKLGPAILTDIDKLNAIKDKIVI